MNKDNHIHEWRIKELQCTVEGCNAISILWEDKEKFINDNRIICDDCYVDGVPEGEEKTRCLKEENQKLKEDISISDNKVMYLANETILLMEENQRLRNRIIELTGDYTLLERENQKLREEILPKNNP